MDPSLHSPNDRVLRIGEYLFREGDSPYSVFLVKKGTLSIRKKRGHEYVEIGKIYANEVVGELSFFDRAFRSASAVALSEVEVAEIPFQALDKIYETVPKYLKTIVSSMAERLRKADETIRRLQKETIRDQADGGDPTRTESPSAQDVIAAAAAIDLSKKKSD